MGPPGDVILGDDDEARADPRGALVRRHEHRIRSDAYFVSQFDSTLEKYFDDFVLNGKENLAKIWGKCVGCPTGADATARDIVEYIARGQIKTLVCYDAFPSLSFGQIQKMADWYEKTQKFQRAVDSGDGNLEDKVNAFFRELAKPYESVRSGAAIDTDVANEWQYTDVPE